MTQQYPSALLEKAVAEFSSLPGIGQKTALRLVLFLLRQDKDKVERFAQTISEMIHKIKHCTVCHNISDTDVCPICSDARRDDTTVCVVENVQDVMAIENTQQYNGLYHVLGGVISPMDGIGPNDIEISSLAERVESGKIKEVILALSSTMEGDTTNFYIYRKLAKFDIRLSVMHAEYLWAASWNTPTRLRSDDLSLTGSRSTADNSRWRHLPENCLKGKY